MSIQLHTNTDLPLGTGSPPSYEREWFPELVCSFEKQTNLLSLVGIKTCPVCCELKISHFKKDH
jgi:hypothetical protein